MEMGQICAQAWCHFGTLEACSYKRWNDGHAEVGYRCTCSAQGNRALCDRGRGRHSVSGTKTHICEFMKTRRTHVLLWTRATRAGLSWWHQRPTKVGVVGWISAMVKKFRRICRMERTRECERKIRGIGKPWDCWTNPMRDKKS